MLTKLGIAFGLLALFSVFRGAHNQKRGNKEAEKVDMITFFISALIIFVILIIKATLFFAGGSL